MEPKVIRICICGHFGGDKNFYDGQTIKTKAVYEELKKKYGTDNIIKIDTYKWKKHAFTFLIKCTMSFFKSTDIIILPAHKGIKVFVPLYTTLKKFSKKKIHYITIGSWIANLLKKNNKLLKKIRNVDYIYVENNKLVNQLNKLNLKNVCVMKNFKNLSVSKVKHSLNNKDFKCCIFSRIEAKKGISDAIKLVNEINNNYKEKVTLDIYGQINETYKNDFYQLINKNKFIKYAGVIEPYESVSTIDKYDLLLFPTKYYTEGIPGTIIDTFFSGVPVLSSKWENFDEIIDDGINGIGYKFDDYNDFKNKFINILNNKQILETMRNNCKKKAKEYLPNNALEILYNNIEN